MSPFGKAVRCCVASIFVAAASLAQTHIAPEGLFQGSSDIGTAQPGASIFDKASRSYQMKGGGDDVWGTSDAFRYTWTRLSGDLTLAADVKVAQPGTSSKAKGMLMIRQSLEPGSPYADIAVHADGHITLQYRLTKGGETKDTDMPEHGNQRLQIARKGDVYTASVLSDSAAPAPTIQLELRGPVYVGLGACSHDVAALQSVSFSHVTIQPAASASR